MSTDALDVVISFDTTGSMAACLGEVRKRSKELVQRLFKEIPELRVGVMAHGDYEDAKKTYLLRKVDLTNNQKEVLDFIKKVPKTYGGDAPEAYEFALHEARGLAWRPGIGHVLIVIGDDVPHTPDYKGNKDHLDWKVELQGLINLGVKVYGVQAHGSDGKAKKFYETLAKKSGGTYLNLGNFATSADLLLGIAMHERGEESLSRYAKEVAAARRMDRGLRGAYEAMLKRPLTAEEAGDAADAAAAPAADAPAADAPAADAPAAAPAAPKKRAARKAAAKKPAAKKAAAKKPAAKKPAAKKPARRAPKTKVSAAAKAKAKARVAKAKKTVTARYKAWNAASRKAGAVGREQAKLRKRLATLKAAAAKNRARVQAGARKVRAARAVLAAALKTAKKLSGK